MLNALLLALVLPLYTIVVGLIVIPHAVFTGNRSLLYSAARLGLRIGFAVIRVRIVLHGRDRLSKHPHFIYMMNHNSNLDVPAVFLHLPGEVRVLGKQELFKIPIVASAMRVGGFVPIDRSNRKRAVASLKEAARIAATGTSFLLAPEGTRSRTGKLLPFKKGGFHMAIQSQVPVLPVTVVGAFELMPPRSIAIRSGTIEIFFHDPIETSGLENKDRFDLIRRVRQPMSEMLG